MKQSDFLRMLHSAHNVPNGYNNKFPRNLGYYDGKKYTFDCWNLVKVILAGWQPTGVVGTYTKPTVTGDITGAAILAKCKEKSEDFTKLSIPGTYLYMTKPAHAGVYVGEFSYGGKIYNVVECTTSFGGGVVYSWVDPDGSRRKYKGYALKSHKWSAYGLLPWVIYETDSPYMIDGYDYSPVFDPVYYAARYKDLRDAFGNDARMLWYHFTVCGMNEFRQASEEFNPEVYRARYADVAKAYGDNKPLYYFHYCAFGKKEGRKGN